MKATSVISITVFLLLTAFLPQAEAGSHFRVTFGSPSYYDRPYNARHHDRHSHYKRHHHDNDYRYYDRKYDSSYRYNTNYNNYYYGYQSQPYKRYYNDYNDRRYRHPGNSIRLYRYDRH